MNNQAGALLPFVHEYLHAFCFNVLTKKYENIAKEWPCGVKEITWILEIQKIKIQNI